MTDVSDVACCWTCSCLMFVLLRDFVLDLRMDDLLDFVFIRLFNVIHLFWGFLSCRILGRLTFGVLLFFI